MSIRMRHTSGHTRNRRSHHALVATKAVIGEAGTLVLPHRVDEATGMYRGKQIFTPKTKEPSTKVKGVSGQLPHVHEGAHTHAHDNAAAKGPETVSEKVETGGRPQGKSK